MERAYVFIVGRDAETATILTPPEYKRVSRKHLRLEVGRNGGCRIVDLDSTNGTERWDGDWRGVKQCDLRPSEKIRLGGEFETCCAALLGLGFSQTQSAALQKPKAAAAAAAAAPVEQVAQAANSGVELDAGDVIRLADMVWDVYKYLADD